MCSVGYCGNVLKGTEKVGPLLCVGLVQSREGKQRGQEEEGRRSSLQNEKRSRGMQPDPMNSPRIQKAEILRPPKSGQPASLGKETDKGKNREKEEKGRREGQPRQSWSAELTLDIQYRRSKCERERGVEV